MHFKRRVVLATSDHWGRSHQLPLLSDYHRHDDDHGVLVDHNFNYYRQGRGRGRGILPRSFNSDAVAVAIANDHPVRPLLPERPNGRRSNQGNCCHDDDDDDEDKVFPLQASSSCCVSTPTPPPELQEQVRPPPRRTLQEQNDPIGEEIVESQVAAGDEAEEHEGEDNLSSKSSDFLLLQHQQHEDDEAPPAPLQEEEVQILSPFPHRTAESDDFDLSYETRRMTINDLTEWIHHRQQDPPSVRLDNRLFVTTVPEATAARRTVARTIGMPRAAARRRLVSQGGSSIPGRSPHNTKGRYRGRRISSALRHQSRYPVHIVMKRRMLDPSSHRGCPCCIGPHQVEVEHVPCQFKRRNHDPYHEQQHFAAACHGDEMLLRRVRPRKKARRKPDNEEGQGQGCADSPIDLTEVSVRSVGSSSGTSTSSSGPVPLKTVAPPSVSGVWPTETVMESIRTKKRKDRRQASTSSLSSSLSNVAPTHHRCLPQEEISLVGKNHEDMVSDSSSCENNHKERHPPTPRRFMESTSPVLARGQMISNTPMMMPASAAAAARTSRVTPWRRGRPSVRSYACSGVLECDTDDTDGSSGVRANHRSRIGNINDATETAGGLFVTTTSTKISTAESRQRLPSHTSTTARPSIPSNDHGRAATFDTPCTNGRSLPYKIAVGKTTVMVQSFPSLLKASERLPNASSYGANLGEHEHHDHL